jgi:putative membrane protein
MMPWGGAGATGLGLFWSLLALLLVVAVLAALASLAFRLSEGRESGEADALSVLRRRYASGEIDDEEFERRRTRLDGDPAS